MIKEIIRKLIGRNKDSWNTEKSKDEIIEREKKFLEVIRKLIEPDKDSWNTERSKDEIIERVNKFLKEHLYYLILDDLIFSKEEQRIWLKVIDKEIENLKVIISYPWMYNKVKVAFAGRFSSGKSSIINSLLNIDLLPTDITPTTAIPSYITFIPTAEQNIVYVINKEGKVISIPIDLFKEIKHDNIKAIYGTMLQALIDFVFINYHSEVLTKIIIIDTPGYDSLSNIDRARSLKVLKSSDLIFWVVDIEDGDISKEALDTIKKVKKEGLLDKNFCIILNKVDRKPPSAHSKVRNNIEETLKREGINFKNIFLFSTKEKERYLPEIWNFIRKVQNESIKLPFFSKVRDCIESIIDRVVNSLKDLSTEKEKHDAFLKYLREKNMNELNRIIKTTFYQYANRDIPLLGKEYYKIYEAEDYLKTLSNKILNSVDDLINKLLPVYLELNKSYNEQKHLEKLLDQARLAIKELEKLEEEIIGNIINSITGGKNGEDGRA